MLADVWEVLNFAWGNATEEDTAAALASVNAEPGLLAIEDGDVGGREGDSSSVHDGSSVTTTIPEQTADDPMEAMPEDGYEIPDTLAMSEGDEGGHIYGYGIYGMDPEVYHDGTQPDAMDDTQPDAMDDTIVSSPEAPCFSSSSEAMLPPAPPSPGAVQRKAELMAKRDELRQDIHKSSKLDVFHKPPNL